MLIPLLTPKGLGPYLGYVFDSGNYDSYTLVDSVPTVRIVPRIHWSGYWNWWCVRSAFWSGATPHFLVTKTNHYSNDAGQWHASWASELDTDTWYLFDNVTIGASDIEFYHNTPFPGGMIYVAALPAYPFSRTQRLLSSWALSSLVDETPSTSDFILGYATARDNGDGRTAEALPFYGFKVTQSSAYTKNKAVLTAGNHPSETPGRYIFEGAIEWLLTSGVKQNFLLDWFNFFCYPCLNPQGVVGGWFRSSPQTPTQDNNRLWDGTGVNEAVDAFKAAWNTDWNNVLEVGIDFHSWATNDGFKGFCYDSTTALWVAYIAALQALDATYVQRADATTASMLCNYWNSLSAALSGTIDHGCVTSLGPTEWKTAGARTLEAIANLLAAGRFTNNPGVGSRDFNGSTDRIDFPALSENLTGQPVTVSAWCLFDGWTTPNDYVVHVHPSGDANYAMVLSQTGTSQIQFLRNGTTWLGRGGYTVAFGSTWHQITATHDGTMTDYTKIHVYIDGVECTTYTLGQNGAGEIAPTGSVSLGGRIYDDTRNLDGHICQVGIWKRVLSSTEIANLVAGHSPDTMSTDLLFYFKGNTSSLVANPGGTGTADGTSQVTGVGNGPSIFYA